MKLPKGFYKEVVEAKATLNATYFNEIPLKKRISTTPLNSGGASFKTHILIKKSNSKLVYKPSVGIALFCFIFLVVGLTVLFFGSYTFMTTENKYEDFPIWFVIIFGGIFTFAGSFMFYYNYKPRVFDKQLGMYYKAYKVSLHKTTISKFNSQISLKSIIAIQIIGETITSDDSSYNSFELNLVTVKGKRFNVVDHGNLKSILNDAKMLSDFLNVPIWHAQSHKDNNY